MIGGLIIAWILSLFNFDEVCITAMQELFSIEISVATYYFIFAVLGWIFD